MASWESADGGRWRYGVGPVPFFLLSFIYSFFSLILMLILKVMHWSASKYFFADHTHAHVHTYNKSTHRHTYTQKHTQANSYHQPASFPTRKLNLGVARNTEQAWVVSDMLKMKWTNGNEKKKKNLRHFNTLPLCSRSTVAIRPGLFKQ